MFIADQPSQFAQFHSYQDLALFIWKANYFFLSLQRRTWQRHTAGNLFTCDWHTCQTCHHKTSKRMCAWHILKFYYATSTPITLIFLVFLVVKFHKILHTLRYRCLLFKQNFLKKLYRGISVMFLKLLNFVISSKPLDKIFYFSSKLFFLMQFLLENAKFEKIFTDGNSRNCFK